MKKLYFEDTIKETYNQLKWYDNECIKYVREPKFKSYYNYCREKREYYKGCRDILLEFKAAFEEIREKYEKEKEKNEN